MIRYNTNNLMSLCVAVGILANIYIVTRLTIGFKILEDFPQIQEFPSRCVIDEDYFLSFVESRRVTELKEKVFLKNNNDKTVQLKLFAFQSAGLGNKLFEIISLLGIANSLQRRPVIDATIPSNIRSLHKSIQPLFPKLVEQFDLKMIPASSVSSHQMNWVKCCIFDDPKKMLNRSEQHLMLNGHYFQSFKYFHHLRSEIREWLAPSKMAKLAAETVLTSELKEDLIICTHIRRGDFQTDGVHQPSDPNFTRAATDFLVKHYQKWHYRTTVVVFGNDVNFSKAVFEDRVSNSSVIPNRTTPPLNFPIPENSPKYSVILPQNSTPENDLAFSRQAPSSTFGWWLSYLAKRSAVVYYRDIRETKDKVINDMNPNDFYPPEWIKLGTRPNGDIFKF
ncbi:L-Fucosyltransferase [Caenorhabditis elegans]|uniref:L-Fucosyltransferase n=1 Tax=Caenorhabditis elegans TaxID=6239 RepID=O45839_CAEEL|nr:L-Fucosyltransferase [Caenorhabditis elegans]CAB03434.3 L-Fucosyltransferase [Caenorhabditis elegans]